MREGRTLSGMSWSWAKGRRRRGVAEGASKCAAPLPAAAGPAQHLPVRGCPGTHSVQPRELCHCRCRASGTAGTVRPHALPRRARTPQPLCSAGAFPSLRPPSLWRPPVRVALFVSEVLSRSAHLGLREAGSADGSAGIAVICCFCFCS